MKKCSICNRMLASVNFSKNDSRCKACNSERIKSYRRTKIGLIASIYSTQKRNSTKRKHLKPNYTREELIRWVTANEMFEKMFTNWVNSGYNIKLTPSCDRLNDYDPYSFNNIRLVTWDENNKKGNNDRKTGVNNKASKHVIQYDRKFNLINTYKSISIASRETGISHACISYCANGKTKISGGYMWGFK